MIPTSYSRLLRELDPSWIVHEDEALLVVDKPEGVAAHAEAEGLVDDLASRVHHYLGFTPSFHHRLDRETSGLVLITKTEGARREIARAFEAGEVRKHYVAGIHGASPPPSELRHFLTPRTRGKVRVIPARDARSWSKRAVRKAGDTSKGWKDPSDRRAKLAITRISPLDSRSGRSLVSLEPLTGRTHQLRVQLAEVGLPIAGDRLYGKDAAPRMLLHAEKLAFPLGGRVQEFRSALPLCFERFLGGEDRYRIEDRAEVRRALKAAIWRRGALFQDETTDAFRLFHRDRDGISEIAIDYYDGALVLHVYEDEGEPVELGALIEELRVYQPKAVFLKRRISRGHRPIAIETEELAPPDPLLGTRDESPTRILEGGIPYPVDLSDGLSTGIFLDQRHSRGLVRELSRDKRVLNLFSYTGAFTVAAIEGGAESTLSVDASKPATRRARESAAMRVKEGRHRFIAEDVFEMLPRLERRGEQFDLVVVDPPTHARTKKHRFNSGKDWARLLQMILPLVAPGGAVLASTNDHRASHAEFDRILFGAIESAGRRLIERRRIPLPLDFLPGPGGEPHLKVSLLFLA